MKYTIELKLDNIQNIALITVINSIRTYRSIIYTIYITSVTVYIITHTIVYYIQQIYSSNHGIARDIYTYTHTHI